MPVFSFSRDSMLAMLALASLDSCFNKSRVLEKPGLIVFPSPTVGGVLDSIDFFINSCGIELSLNSLRTQKVSSFLVCLPAMAISSGITSKLLPRPVKSLGPAVPIFTFVVRRSISDMEVKIFAICSLRIESLINHSTALCLF